MAKLTRRTCSLAFRNRIKETFPKLHGNIGYWRFLQHLLYGTWRDDTTGNLIISHDMLAGFNDTEPNHFHSGSFLKAFSADILNVECSSWQVGVKVREVLRADIPQDIMNALDEDRKLLAHQIGLVQFDTGNIVNSRKKSEMRSIDKRDALETFVMAGCQEAKNLLDYMNNLDARRFQIDNAQYERALEHLEAMNIDTHAKRRMLDILRAAQVQPVTMYGATSRSVRIYARNDSILMLPREVRSILTKGLLSFDLRAAQLSVISKTWNIPTLYAYLSKGYSVWGYIYDNCNVSRTVFDFKAVIKRAIYSIVFGMRLPNLINGLKDSRGRIVEPGLVDTLKPFNITPEQFLSIPLIKDILAAREIIYRTIVHDRGAYDVFGHWIEVTDTVNERSVAAQVAQSYELKLLSPVVNAAQITDEFFIAYWLHDGLYISIRQMQRAGLWIERIQESVKLIAKELDIPTELEYIDDHV